MPRCLILHPDDDVAVAVEAVAAGDTVQLSDGREIKALEAVPFAHKIAIRALQPGAEVRKYGEVIGAATKEIVVGQHVHVQNIKSLRA
jgi:altronate dehydratase